MVFEFDEESTNRGAKIKVIGIGGGGGNAIDTMISSKMEGVDFIAANTDLQALAGNQAPLKVQLGAKITRGLGAGANPEVGRQACEADSEVIIDSMRDADMVFITAGMGGGTGTGGAPVIGALARETGALTVGVVTKPFLFEGRHRMRQAEEGIKRLREAVDTLIIIPNQRLLNIAEKDMTFMDSFKKADEILLHAVKGISDLIVVQGLINLDFADVRTIMNQMGMAMMGIGRAKGENRAIEAARLATESPLLEDMQIDGALGILINISGDDKLTLYEVNEAAVQIQERAHEDANIIFGAVIDRKLKDELSITVIATGFDQSEGQRREFDNDNITFLNNIKEETREILSRTRSADQSPVEVESIHSIKEEIPPVIMDKTDLEIPAFLRKKAD